ncbi:MAG: transposase [Clostridiales bacterium]|nr:transposase [Clostridiales bacterium]
MPRPLRQFHPGGIYHITHRGHNKFHIFEETIDKAHFLDILRKVVQETGCHVLFYTIMDNHYHLLIEMQEMPLDKVMRRLNTRYAIYYTKKHRLSGSVLTVITQQAKSKTKSILYL